MDSLKIIIFISIGLISVITTSIILFLYRIQHDVKKILRIIDGLGKRLDNHTMRVDQLCHMIIDILKQDKK